MHPWKVTLSYDADLDLWTSTMSVGRVCTYLMPSTISISGPSVDTVTANTIISLETSKAVNPDITIKYSTVELLGDFVPQEVISDDLKTRYPLAYIVNNPATQQLEVRQLARSNFWLVDVCYNGQKAAFLTPI